MAFVAGVMVLGLLPAQAAWAASQDIHSNGPLTDIWTGDDLTCQVAHTGSTGTTYQFYGGAPGSCGTFLSIDTPGGDPQSFGYGAAASTTYTPVSQSAVTGSGTADDPYRVTTVEAAGSTGLQVTQVDSYVAGNDYYQTDMTVTNTSSATASGRLYHAADCYLQGSDVGYGYVDASKNAVACAANANNSPRALIEEFAPLTGSAKYVEAGYSTVWSDVRSQTDLPSTCDCTIREDNGMGINWDFSLAPGASQTFSLLSNFSSSGVLADHTISATGDRSFTDTVPVHVSGTLASFTDSKPNTAPSEYSAAIDWGDGVTSQGTVSATDGGFSVSGDHTYTAIGSYTISVTISDVNGNANDATVTDSATANPSHSITATGGNSLSGTEPATVNGTLATFSDSKPGTDTSEYAATIDWGDDSSSSGTISANGGGFSVSGNHKYSSAGSYTISVTISDVNNDADSQTVTDSAAIAARHTITATGDNAFTGTAPATVNGTLATFSDSKAGTAPSEYSATIDWGDHTAASAGTITVSNGSFVVSGSHTYSSPGSYTIAVTISDVNGNANSPTVNDSATVSAPPVAPASGSPTPTSPGATTGSPTPTSSTAANLSGSANPGGLPTTAHWEYGLDPGQRGPGFTGNVYDQSTPSQPVGSDFSSHTLATSVSNLVPNALYHVRLVASNSAGTTVGPDRTFTTPKAGSPPPPVLGQNANFSPVGTVFVLLNGQFVKLTQPQQLPSGTVVDALHGSLNLVAASGKKGQKYTGTFSGAVFKVTQARSGADKALTTVSILEGAFKGAPSYVSCKAKGAADGFPPRAHAALGARVLQTLRSSARGRFRTRGRYAAATVRGTRWTTVDRCDGTLISVQLHSVLVNDLVRGITRLVNVGHSYLARAPKTKG